MTSNMRPRPDLFGRDERDDLLDESLDSLFNFFGEMVRGIVQSPFDFLLHFETHKLEFRRLIKEVIRAAIK